MGDKKRVTGNKMSVTDYTDPLFAGKSAKRMATDLLGKYCNGPHETIDSAAYRIQTEFGVDADIIKQGWNREPRGRTKLTRTKGRATMAIRRWLGWLILLLARKLRGE